MQKGIPYMQFLRLCRICSCITEFDNNAVNLARHFSRCGYPQELIETSLVKARRRDRTELLQLAVPTNATKESTFYFITTHFPGPNSPRAIDEKNWSIKGVDVYKMNSTGSYLPTCSLTTLFVRLLKISC